MDLSHEEKLIALKGFQAGFEKEAAIPGFPAIWAAAKGAATAGAKSTARQSGKVVGKAKEVGSKGKALWAGATGKGVGAAGRTPAGVAAGHTSKGQLGLYNAGKKVYDHRGKVMAGTGIGGTALVMRD